MLTAGEISSELSLYSFKNLPKTWSYYIRLFTFFLGIFDDDSILFQLDHEMIRNECCTNIFRLLIGNQINTIYRCIGMQPDKVIIDSSTTLYYPRGKCVTCIDDALQKSVILRDNSKNKFIYIYEPEVGVSEKWLTLCSNISYILINPYIHGLLMVSMIFVLYKMIQWTRSLFKIFS